MQYGLLRTLDQRKLPLVRPVVLTLVYLSVFLMPWWVSVTCILAVLVVFGYYEVLGAAVLFDALFGVSGVFFLRTEFLITTLALVLVALRYLWRHVL